MTDKTKTAQTKGVVKKTICVECGRQGREHEGYFLGLLGPVCTQELNCHRRREQLPA